MLGNQTFPDFDIKSIYENQYKLMQSVIFLNADGDDVHRTSKSSWKDTSCKKLFMANSCFIPSSGVPPIPKTSDYFEITETVEMGKLASLFFNKSEYLVSVRWFVGHFNCCHDERMFYLPICFEVTV